MPESLKPVVVCSSARCLMERVSAPPSDLGKGCSDCGLEVTSMERVALQAFIGEA